MEVLRKTENVMCNKYDYGWEDSTTLNVKTEYKEEYDKYYTQFWIEIFKKERDEHNNKRKSES